MRLTAQTSIPRPPNDRAAANARGSAVRCGYEMSKSRPPRELPANAKASAHHWINGAFGMQSYYKPRKARDNGDGPGAGQPEMQPRGD
jgi:hypothetical protein